MKTGKRSYPLDQLSVSEDGVSVSIHTHRQSIQIRVDDGVYEWSEMLSFEELMDMLMGRLEEHGEKAPSCRK